MGNPYSYNPLPPDDEDYEPWDAQDEYDYLENSGMIEPEEYNED